MGSALILIFVVNLATYFGELDSFRAIEIMLTKDKTI